MSQPTDSQPPHLAPDDELHLATMTHDGRTCWAIAALYLGSPKSKTCEEGIAKAEQAFKDSGYTVGITDTPTGGQTLLTANFTKRATSELRNLLDCIKEGAKDWITVLEDELGARQQIEEERTAFELEEQRLLAKHEAEKADLQKRKEDAAKTVRERITKGGLKSKAPSDQSVGDGKEKKQKLDEQ